MNLLQQEIPQQEKIKPSLIIQSQIQLYEMITIGVI